MKDNHDSEDVCSVSCRRASASSTATPPSDPRLPGRALRRCGWKKLSTISRPIKRASGGCPLRCCGGSSELHLIGAAERCMSRFRRNTRFGGVGSRRWPGADPWPHPRALQPQNPRQSRSPSGRARRQRPAGSERDATSRSPPGIRARCCPSCASDPPAYSKPKDVVVDPMCGIGTPLSSRPRRLDRRCIGVELEERWVAIARSNLAHALPARQRRLAEVRLGDARSLVSLLKGFRGRTGLVLTSPPYACEAGVIDKRAWLRGRRLCDASTLNYSADLGNIGHARGERYHAAMAAVYAQCFALLRPGGLLVTVTKNMRHRGRLIDLDIHHGRPCRRRRLRTPPTQHRAPRRGASRDLGLASLLLAAEPDQSAHGCRAFRCISSRTRTSSCSSSRGSMYMSDSFHCRCGRARSSHPRCSVEGATCPMRSRTQRRCFPKSRAEPSVPTRRPETSCSTPCAGSELRWWRRCISAARRVGVEYEPRWGGCRRSQPRAGGGIRRHGHW